MSENKRISSRQRLLLGAGIVAVLVILGAWAVQYILVGQYLVGTDDAYLAADSSLIAAKVSGYVADVAVRDNQPVAKGQVLVQIDPRDYEAALAASTAQLQAAEAQIANIEAQLALQQSRIAAAKASVAGDTARLAFAEENARRYATLSAKGASPVQTLQQANTDLQAARAILDADNAALQAAHRQVDVLDAQAKQAQAGEAEARAQLAQARLNLEHTTIRAPFDGVVGNKTVALGDYLQPGTQVMAVVPLAQVYIVANYKETQVTHIRPGQPVRIHVDGFPALDVRGHVDSIFPASGQEFALLPPDNATGNFTKIVQRVPVKIVIDLTPAETGKLRPGMSVEPEIDTRRAP